MATERKEVWLQGEKTAGLSPLLQPVADALLESYEEIKTFMTGFPEELLWEKPAGSASVGFHLKHIPGVIDRLLTYAEGKKLTDQQFTELKDESVEGNITQNALLTRLQKCVHNGVERLKAIPEPLLPQTRTVGRAGLPSTVIGLCFHAAEHSMRHTGQLLVTVRWLTNQRQMPII